MDIDAGYIDGDVALNAIKMPLLPRLLQMRMILMVFRVSIVKKFVNSTWPLTRHTNVKHANVLSSLSNETEKLSPTPLTPLEVSIKKLHPVKLRVMVKMCAENIATDLCFPVNENQIFH